MFYLQAGSVRIYHGDNKANLKNLPIESMYHEAGNFQEGVGIYFTNKIESAENYGEHVYKISVNPKDFLWSRKTLREQNIKKYPIARIIRLCRKDNPSADEELFYTMSDYVYIENKEDITDDLIMEWSENLLDEEVRNFQTTIAEIFGVEAFVKAWNKVLHDAIIGTKHPNSSTEMRYVVIKPNFRLVKVQQTERLQNEN